VLAAPTRVLPILACLTLVAAGVGCDSTRLATASSPAASSGPRTASPSPPPGYKAYISPDLFSSFAYPDTWFNVGRDQDGSFYGLNIVSENIGSPIQLRQHDIWFSVAVSTRGKWGPSGEGRACGLPADQFPNPNSTELKVSIGGVTTSAYVATKPGGPDMTAGIAGPELLHEGWCYSFSAITVSVATTNEHLTEIQQIYSSFRFNR